MSLTLVILAAGMGSRFGGKKHLAEVGPQGQSLFEYSVYDAVRSGFNHIVFVVSQNQNTAEFSNRLQCYESRITISFVRQKLSTGTDSTNLDLNSLNRKKPWGTGHAVLACRSVIDSPFAVINADDYYGQSNFKRIGAYLIANAGNPHAAALPGYLLKATLSKTGGVNRGVCEVNDDGYLQSIREVKNIRFDGETLEHDTENYPIDLNSLVSMTFWGFQPSIFSLLELTFSRFLSDSSNLENEEFYIPAAIDFGLSLNQLQVKVFRSTDRWKGVTYAQDIAELREFIGDTTETGAYPDIGTKAPELEILHEVATALLFDSDGKLLIYLRDEKPDIPFPGCWDLFGGHVEEGESPDVALVREVQEELGIQLTSHDFFRTYHCREGDVTPNIKHVYTAQIDQCASSLTLYEGQRLMGINLNQRHQFQFANILSKIIDDYSEYKTIREKL